MSAKTLLDTLKASFGGPAELDEPRPLEQILLLILANRSDMRKARTAMQRLESEYVDWNEVRVTSSYELAKWLRPLGAKKAQDKAEQAKELLTTVYNRFNKLNLDFLRKDGKSAAEARKRERFQTYLQDKSLALHVMMSLHGTEKQPLLVTGGLPRMLQRLGVLKGKSNTVTATRAKLLSMYQAEDVLTLQWCLYSLLEAHCHVRSPDCPDCPVLKMCPTGKVESKKRIAAAAAAKQAAAKQAAKQAAKERAAAKKAAAKEKAAAKKAAAKEKAAAKKAAAKKAAKKKVAKKAAKKKVAKKAAKKKVAKKAAKKKVTRGRSGRSSSRRR